MLLFIIYILNKFTKLSIITKLSTNLSFEEKTDYRIETLSKTSVYNY